MELVLPQFTVAVLVFFGQVYSAPVPKKIHSDRLYACKDLVSNESIIDPTALCRIDVQFEGFVQIGEHVVIRGGKFGPSFSVRELSMLGKHIVAGRSVKLSRRVCIEDDTILDHGLKVHKGGMAKMLGEKLVITYPPAGSRYILRDGKCLGYKVKSRTKKSKSVPTKAHEHAGTAAEISENALELKIKDDSGELTLFDNNDDCTIED